MESYTVKALSSEAWPTSLQASVPGSKSMTNRALLLAAMASGKSLLKGILFSEDSRAFLDCLKALGFSLEIQESIQQAAVHGTGGKLPASAASCNVGSAGTAARFITALTALSGGTYTLQSSPQMKKRPMAPLLKALRDLGIPVVCLEEEGHFPLQVGPAGRIGHEISLNIDESSQFLSALLMVAPLTSQGLSIHLTGSRQARSYVNMTMDMMKAFGVNVPEPEGDVYQVPGQRVYHARTYAIEPDVSAACYFYALAMLLGCAVTVPGVYPDSLQGDLRFLRLLSRMGGTLVAQPEGLCLVGPENGRYPGITVEMTDFSDQALTLAALAVYAEGPTTITGIGHIRRQESDRILAMEKAYAAMGLESHSTEDCITLYPGTPRPCSIETFQDHRVAMAMTLVGLRTPGIVILDPSCTSKTFSGYFYELERLLYTPAR